MRSPTHPRSRGSHVLFDSFIRVEWLNASFIRPTYTFDMAYAQSKTLLEPRRYCDYFRCLCPISLWVSKYICATYLCVCLSLCLCLCCCLCLCLSVGTWMYVSRRTCEWVMATHRWVTSRIFECVTSHMWIWVKSHIWRHTCQSIHLCAFEHAHTHACECIHTCTLHMWTWLKVCLDSYSHVNVMIIFTCECESRHTREWMYSHVCIRTCAHAYKKRARVCCNGQRHSYTCEWVMSHMQAFCYIYIWVTSQMSISHVAHRNESCRTHTMRYVTNMDESRRTCQWATLHKMEWVTSHAYKRRAVACCRCGRHSHAYEKVQYFSHTSDSTENDTTPKSKKSRNSNSSVQIQIRISICTARYREMWVSRFGGFWGCSNFGGNCQMKESHCGRHSQTYWSSHWSYMWMRSHMWIRHMWTHTKESHCGRHSQRYQGVTGVTCECGVMVEYVTCEYVTCEHIRKSHIAGGTLTHMKESLELHVNAELWANMSRRSRMWIRRMWTHMKESHCGRHSQRYQGVFIAHVNALCHMYWRVTLPMFISHVSQTNTSWHTRIRRERQRREVLTHIYKWVTTHMLMRYVTFMGDLCCICAWLTSR